MGKDTRHYYILALSILTFFVPLCSSSFAQQEQLSITTYYPSPHGVFKILTLSPNDDINPAVACANRGQMYYDNSDTTSTYVMALIGNHYQVAYGLFPAVIFTQTISAGT